MFHGDRYTHICINYLLLIIGLVDVRKCYECDSRFLKTFSHLQMNLGQQGFLVVLKTGKIVSSIYNPLSFLFFDVLGITLTHLLVFKHRLGALEILKEKNSTERRLLFATFILYSLKWKKG
jgi:hypothetical protein